MNMVTSSNCNETAVSINSGTEGQGLKDLLATSILKKFTYISLHILHLYYLPLQVMVMFGVTSLDCNNA